MSKFPTEIDTDAELPSVIDGSTEIAGDAINAQKDAILSIERALGTDPQGTTASLADRLDVSINPDGTLNSSAIAAAWLLSSPITNAHVSATAAIDESKINLDVSTSLLQDQITDLSIDVEALQGSVGSAVAQLASHITGSDYRHAAQHIVVSPSVAAGTNAQTALQNVYAELNSHIADSVGAHDADAISYSPAPGSNLSATSVGGALDEIDSNFINRVNRHLDTAHSNGISSDGYIYLGGQGAVNAASFAAVPFQPLSGQPRIKIGGINHATLISRGANPAGLGSGASGLLVDYSDGYSLYTASVTGLNSCPYPAGSENRLRGAVVKFNEAFKAVGALVTAFQFGNEIVLQHNTPDGYIAVREPSIASAAGALGFSSVVGQRAQPISHFVAVTDGIPIDGWIPLASGTATLSGPSLLLSVSSPVAVGSLVHITNHTGLGAGTYQVVAVAGSIATLNKPIPAGSFSYSVLPDSVAIGAASSGTTYEVLVDSAGIPSTSARANITVSPISGLRIVECSLQPGTYSLSITGTGSVRSLYISSGTISGSAVQLAQGYVGAVMLRAPKGMGTVLVEVASLSPPSPVTAAFEVFASVENDGLQKVCSYWSNGLVVEFPSDTRNIGLVSAAALATDVFSKAIAEYPSNYWNGLVSADAPLVSGASLQISASRFLIGGVIKDLAAAEISFTSTPIAYGTYNLYVDLGGSLRLGLESGAGVTLQNIVSRGEIPLARVTYNGTLSVIDLRLFSLAVPPTDRLLVGGAAGTHHCPDIAGALLIAAAAGFNKVVLQADQSTALDVVVPAAVSVEGQFSLTCRTLSLAAGSSISISEIITTVTTPTVTGISALDTGSIFAASISTRALSLANHSSLGFFSCLLTGSSGSGIVTLSIAGEGVRVCGSAPGATLSFASGGTLAITSASDVLLKDALAVFDSTQFDWIELSGVCGTVSLEHFSAQRSGSISTAQIQTHSVILNSGTVDSVMLDSCAFEECGAVFSNTGTAEHVSISSCSGSNFGGALKAASGSSTAGATISDFYGYRLYGNALGVSGATNVAMSNSVFYGTFGGSQTQVRAFYSTDTTSSPSAVNASISKCTFSGMAFEDFFIAATGLLTTSSVSLNISDCTFSGITSSISQSSRTSAAGNLVYWNSDSWLRLANCSMPDCSFKIGMGYNFELSGNTVDISTTATQLQAFNVNRALASTDPGYARALASINGNRITISGNSLVQLSSASVYDNDISASRFIFDYGVSDSPLPIYAGYAVSNNVFESLDSSASSTFIFYPGYNVSSNKFYGEGTGSLLTLGVLSSGNGFLKFSNNVCSYLPPAPAQAIIVVDDGPLSGIKYSLDANILQLADTTGSAVDNAIQIVPNNVVCSSNYIVGEGVTGVIFRGAGSGQSGCRITGNNIAGGTADGTDLPADANTFENNHGTTNIYALSPFKALLPDPTSWNASSTSINSSTNGAVAWIPVDVPSGELLEIAAGFNFSIASGSVLMELYTIPATSTTTTLVGSVTLTPSAAGYASASIIPGTAPFIGPAKTAALKITRNAGSATVTIGNIRAVVKL